MNDNLSSSSPPKTTLVFQEGWEYYDEIHGWVKVPAYLIGKVVPPGLYVRQKLESKK